MVWPRTKGLRGGGERTEGRRFLFNEKRGLEVVGRKQKRGGTKLARLLHYYHFLTQVSGVLLATLEAVVWRLVMREAWFGSRTKSRRFYVEIMARFDVTDKSPSPGAGGGGRGPSSITNVSFPWNI